MTTLIIDNKAIAKRAYEKYIVDRTEYPTIEHLRDLVSDCMNDEVYKISVYENDVELFTIRNHK